jgi:hypothetical protein
MDKILEKDKVRGEVPDRTNGIKDKAYGSFLSTLDPRNNEQVQAALAASPDPRFQEFLDRISKPGYNRVSLQSIAKACQIDLREFNIWWQKESAQRSIAIAQTASVQVTQDMAADAMSRMVACERCDGLGWVSAPPGLPDTVPGYRMIEAGEEPKYIRDCPNGCNSGKIRKPGDTHSRNTLLEMGGLLKQKGTGPSVTLNFGGASHSTGINALSDAMTIDVEAV